MVMRTPIAQPIGDFFANLTVSRVLFPYSREIRPINCATARALANRRDENAVAIVVRHTPASNIRNQPRIALRLELSWLASFRGE